MFRIKTIFIATFRAQTPKLWLIGRPLSRPTVARVTFDLPECEELLFSKEHEQKRKQKNENKRKETQEKKGKQKRKQTKSLKKIKE